MGEKTQKTITISPWPGKNKIQQTVCTWQLVKCKEGQTYNYVMRIVESTTKFVKTATMTCCAIT